MTTPEPGIAEKVLGLLLEEIEQKNLDVYRNVVNTPYLHYRHPDFPELHASLWERDARSWIIFFAWKRLGTLLRKREVDRILECLAGWSLQRAVHSATDKAQLLAIETDLVVANVVEFMETQNPYENRMREFWKDLKKFAADRTGLKRGRDRFPGGSNVLSRRLSQASQILERLGIIVDLKRANGSIVTLNKRLDGSTRSSSKEPSPTNERSSNDLDHSDDRAVRKSNLEKRKSISLESSNYEKNT